MTSDHRVGRWLRATLTTVAVLALAGCSVQDVLADRAREQAREIAESRPDQPEPPEASERTDGTDEPETPDGPGGTDEPQTPEPPDGTEEPTSDGPGTIDDADLRATSVTPGRFTLGGDGYSLTLPEGYELQGASGVDGDDPEQQIQLQALTGLTADASQFETQLTAVREGPGGEVVYDAPTEVAGADRAHIVVTDDGTDAIGNVVARSDAGSVVVAYVAPSDSFDPAVVGYVADELLVGFASLEEAGDGVIALGYPTTDGDAIQVRFELFGGWYLETEQDVVLRRYVTDRGEELEYRLVVNDRVDLAGLVDELSTTFPDATFDTEPYEVPGADEALLVDIDAADTDDRFVQRSILVGHDVGFTFQLTYVARPDVFDPDAADRHLATFELEITDDLF